VTQPKLDLEAVERLRQRLGPVDELQIQLQMSVSQAQRIRNMIKLRSVMMNSWRRRLRKAHPELNDLDLTMLVYERLDHG
jgi:hypothetical protein